ncbi:MAG: peptidoglycan-binding protein [bacterium]|nr:peptidoglycan-binding protein [bacterium]
MRFSFFKKTIPLFLAGILCAGLLSFSSAGAQAIDILSRIDLLQKQIASLQAKIAGLKNLSGEGGLPNEVVPTIGSFQRYLERGATSDEVKYLQEFLATLPGVYPEKIITGYFGLLTENAVRRFQAKYGIDQLGVVGPRTRSKLNELVQAEREKNISGAPSPQAGVPRIDTPQSSDVAQMPTKTPTTTASGNPLPASPSSFTLEQKPEYDESALAQKVHDRVNQERIRAGLYPLTWDWEIAHVAFLHSSDQARDNEELTDPDILCNYPLIRHEGFLFGYSLQERFQNKNLSFRRGGENIGILSSVKDVVYQFPQDSPPAPCPDIAPFPVGDGTKEERIALYTSAMEESLAAARNADRDIMWVNRSWYTPDELVERIVKGWMDSPGHRANILTPHFDSGGIGVVAVNDYFIITHNFVDR